MCSKTSLFDCYLLLKVAELKKHMFASSIKDLQLDESRKIGYTYKTMGAGFWALRQKDFRKALTTVVMEVTFISLMFSSC